MSFYLQEVSIFYSMRMEKRRSNPKLIISNIPIYRKNNIDFKEIISNIDKKTTRVIKIVRLKLYRLIIDFHE